MTTTTLQQANDVLRSAVRARLDATPADDPKVTGYKIDQGDPEPTCCDGVPQHITMGHDAETLKAAKEYMDAYRLRKQVEAERMRGDSVLRETAVPGSREWLAALERLRALHIEKTGQYGGADDAFENVTASAKCGVEPWRRALCDLSDCVVRMQKYAQGQPVDATNALLDAANWALICLIKMEENANGNR